MPFSASYVNGRTLRDALGGSLALNLDTNTIRVALFTNNIGSGTAQSSNGVEAYGTGAYGADEVAASGTYAAGGQALSDPSVSTPAAGKWTFREVSATSMQWTGVTFNTRGLAVYSVTASNRILAAINFAAPQDVIAGTFTVNWSAGDGIFAVNYTSV
jgi:hypothetical protein